MKSPLQLLLLFILRLYQLCISPLLGPNCRFYPSCSQYAIEAITLHGILKGCFFAIKRICKCHPWHPGGFDPVPLKQNTSASSADDGSQYIV